MTSKNVCYLEVLSDTHEGNAKDLYLRAAVQFTLIRSGAKMYFFRIKLNPVVISGSWTGVSSWLVSTCFYMTYELRATFLNGRNQKKNIIL